MNEQQQLIAVAQGALTSDDYYTPRWVFETLALEFDVDVCSPPGGIEWIPARRFYTVADDGLSQRWEGRVWMNPPFSRPAPWVARFVSHGNGVALVPFAKSAWFYALWDAADAICTPGVELSKFVGGPVFMPCALAAFGPECVEALGRMGVVRVRTEADIVRATTAREAERIAGVGHSQHTEWVPRNQDWRGNDYYQESEDRSAT